MKEETFEAVYSTVSHPVLIPLSTAPFYAAYALSCDRDPVGGRGKCFRFSSSGHVHASKLISSLSLPLHYYRTPYSPRTLSW